MKFNRGPESVGAETAELPKHLSREDILEMFNAREAAAQTAMVAAEREAAEFHAAKATALAEAEKIEAARLAADQTEYERAEALRLRIAAARAEMEAVAAEREAQRITALVDSIESSPEAATLLERAEKFKAEHPDEGTIIDLAPVAEEYVRAVLGITVPEELWLVAPGEFAQTAVPILGMNLRVTMASTRERVLWLVLPARWGGPVEIHDVGSLADLRQSYPQLFTADGRMDTDMLEGRS